MSGIRATLQDLLTHSSGASRYRQTGQPSGPVIWNVTYPRNTLFTGRETELHAIEAALSEGKHATIVQAISGLVGSRGLSLHACQ